MYNTGIYIHSPIEAFKCKLIHFSIVACCYCSWSTLKRKRY